MYFEWVNYCMCAGKWLCCKLLLKDLLLLWRLCTDPVSERKGTDAGYIQCWTHQVGRTIVLISRNQLYLLFTLSVVLDASSISFQYYTDGVYCDTDCNQSGLNHAMLVVGYGTDSTTGEDYWILKNR